MTKNFDNMPELTAALRDALVERLSGLEYVSTFTGASNISRSSYVTVTVETDDVLEDLKIRFSDHADRHGSDLTFRADWVAFDKLDDDDQFICLEVSEEDFDALVVEAQTAVLEFISESLEAA